MLNYSGRLIVTVNGFMIFSAAAIANAVFHATGKRMAHLPITPDKLV
jgi:CO/xanthine dehydrogenase Mo-binding subunit